MIAVIRFGETRYVVHYNVVTGRDASPWGDDPGWPNEVSIYSIQPKAPQAVWAYCEGYLEAELEERQDVRDDYYEAEKADYQRTGGDDD